MARILEDPAGTFGQMISTGVIAAGANAAGQVAGGMMSKFSAGISEGAGFNIDIGSLASALRRVL